MALNGYPYASLLVCVMHGLWFASALSEFSLLRHSLCGISLHRSAPCGDLCDDDMFNCDGDHIGTTLQNTG